MTQAQGVGLTSMQGAFLCPFCSLQGQRKPSGEAAGVCGSGQGGLGEEGPLEKGYFHRLATLPWPSPSSAGAPERPPVRRVVSPGAGTAGRSSLSLATWGLRLLHQGKAMFLPPPLCPA